MKVKCISQCQTDRTKVYEFGKTYDIPDELYANNKDRFEKIEEKNNKQGQK